MSAQYGGTIYQTVSLAALAFASDALPDLSVIGAEESASTVGHDLEAHCYGEAVQAGIYEAPDGVSVDNWRALCRGAIAARVTAHREGRRPEGRDVQSDGDE